MPGGNQSHQTAKHSQREGRKGGKKSHHAEGSEGSGHEPGIKHRVERLTTEERLQQSTSGVSRAANN